MSQRFVFSSSAQSHAGTVRPLNEDAFVLRDEAGMWAVFDGIGGHDAGELASAMLARDLSALDLPGTLGAAADAVGVALSRANTEMLDIAVRRSGISSMGSTAVVLLARQGEGTCCLWAGDSRCYRLRDGKFERLSRDHSLVQELVDSGAIEPDAARSHPRRNVITRAVGIAPDLTIERTADDLVPGDRYLICSDGLTEPLEEATIGTILGQSADAGAAAKALLAAALSAGAADNVTAVVVGVEHG